MNHSPSKLLTLTEYESEFFHPSEIPAELGELLWRNYSDQVELDFPTPKTNNQWKLTSQGWAGYIPLTQEFGLSLRPKVPIENLFGMLEYAYRLKSFKILPGLIDTDSLEDFYERLAKILALCVLDRGRRGLYRSYQPRNNSLPYVHGRVDLRQKSLRPWDVNLPCHYEEHTSDIEDNQILVWTLQHILRSGICTERSLPSVRRAYRTLRGSITPMPYCPQDCAGRIYNRLNQDYHPMHALCRFFLEHSGPSHRVGDRTMLPFLINMARLYELFVAEWLVSNLPSSFSVKAQERIAFGQGQNVHFDIDLVLYENDSQTPRCVMDTKYKVPIRPSARDVEQIVAYAEIKRCKEAILIYPKPLYEPLDAMIGDIRVRSLNFSLDGDLDLAGRSFMRGLDLLDAEL